MSHPPTPRQPVPLRAGTHLDPRFTEPVVLPGFTAATHTQRRAVASIDRRQRVVQTGGEFANFIFHKSGLITLPIPVREAAVAAGVRRYEWVDHELNQCYTITAELADKYGTFYTNRIGRRWGVPLECCDLLDAQGTVIASRSVAR